MTRGSEKRQLESRRLTFSVVKGRGDKLIGTLMYYVFLTATPFYYLPTNIMVINGGKSPLKLIPALPPFQSTLQVFPLKEVNKVTKSYWPLTWMLCSYLNNYYGDLYRPWPQYSRSCKKKIHIPKSTQYKCSYLEKFIVKCNAYARAETDFEQ